MAQEEKVSAIEKLLGFSFVSDPRKARFPLPETPKEHLATKSDRPFPHVSTPITPEMARDILQYRVVRIDRMQSEIRHDAMTHNRRFLLTKLKGGRKKGLIDVVRDGEFNPRTSTPMVFTEDGFLLDGQHRAAACWLAKKAIELPVTTNGQWDTFAVLDIGTGRTAGQLLGDIPHPDRAAAAAKMILPVIEGSEAENWTLDGASNQDIYDLVHGWSFFHAQSSENDSSWMSYVIEASKSKVPMIPLAASTMLALAAGAKPSHVQEFLNGLSPKYREAFPPIIEGGDDPRYLLRKFYMTNDAPRKATDKERRKQISYVRKAMSVWLDYKAYMDGDDTVRIHRITKLQAPAEMDPLPAVWRADRVREFHKKAVS